MPERSPKAEMRIRELTDKCRTAIRRAERADTRAMLLELALLRTELERRNLHEYKRQHEVGKLSSMLRGPKKSR